MPEPRIMIYMRTFLVFVGSITGENAQKRASRGTVPRDRA